LKIGQSICVLADVHGATRVLRRALDVCRDAGVDTIALLGDLFDRPEQADPCVEALEGWDVVGVFGNHERELAEAAAAGAIPVRSETARLLGTLQERIVIDDILFTHEVERWGHSDAISQLLNRESNGHHPAPDARITFAGHTHYRYARDERGPLDVARGSLVLDPSRRYLINPGALAAGQFAILDRSTEVVSFRHVDW
jgi:predicted phosphodiesterase